MTAHHRVAPALAGLALTVAIAAGGPQSATAAEKVSYELDVRPILESRCISCHSSDGAGLAASGLDMSTYEGLMKGTKFGPIVVPGDPITSNLNVLIEGRASAELRMPHNQRPLLRYQTLIIRDWVKQGAENN